MNLIEIAKNGMYFCPAYKHYGQMTNVVCDRCNKTNLKACIGYDNKDLCLKCADALTNMITETNIYTPISVVRDMPSYRTRMMQNMITNRNDNDLIKTKMMQDLFKPPINDIYEPHNVVHRVKKHINKDDDDEMKTYMMQDLFNKF